MTRNPWMGVFARLAAAVLFASVIDAPQNAAGAPILPSDIVDPGGCGSVMLPESCTFANLSDPLLGTVLVDGSFTADEDVALFRFVLSGAAFLSASATDELGLDPLIGLFHAESRDVVLYPDVLGDLAPAVMDDTPDQGLSAILPIIELDAGAYILALIQGGNSFAAPLGGEAPARDNINAGFAWDFDPLSRSGRCSDAGLCGFSLALTATPADAAPVPEPGTLTLMALGAGAAAVARRRRRRR